MAVRFVLSDYVDQALAEAQYDKLSEGSFAGRVPPCKGVIAFGSTLRRCEDELLSTLEDWVPVGLKLRQPFPIIG
jgi:predicted RNase H-like HicB family nuclease